MARNLAIIAALMGLCAAPAAAETYAETTSKIANAIYSGTIRENPDFLTMLPEPELSEVEKLAGCAPELQGGGGDRFLVIEWSCAGNDGGEGFSRSTTMLFGEEGNLRGFSINRAAKDYAPTPAALERSGADQQFALSREFGEAVVSGGDPTLGGLIDLDDFDQARLKRFAGGGFRVPNRRRGGNVPIRFYQGPGRTNYGGAATLRYDAAGIVTGIVFLPYLAGRERSARDYDRAFDSLQSTQRSNQNRSVIDSFQRPDPNRTPNRPSTIQPPRP
ncbi:MAG: hypothetical protein ACMUJI_01340 [Erythrobacter sp.]|uniref:hypothetical protein n=1 Tax=Erythrobacter sp. TaxID=1042 RepID=UPI003A8B6973